jgi:soluble lytic murein transglycosylase-like protein
MAALARGNVHVRVGVMGLPWHRYAGEIGGSRTALDAYTNLRIAAARLAPYLGAQPALTARRRSREFDRLITRLAPRFALDPELVREVVAAESDYDPRAISPKGAQGLMQLMPATAARFGIRDVWDPQENLMGGMGYLKYLLAYYRGDLTRVLAAYNAGEAVVDRHGGISPYAETRRYVARILKRYGKPTHPYRRALAQKGDRAEARS